MASMNRVNTSDSQDYASQLAEEMKLLSALYNTEYKNQDELQAKRLENIKEFRKQQEDMIKHIRSLNLVATKKEFDDKIKLLNEQEKNAGSKQEKNEIAKKKAQLEKEFKLSQKYQEKLIKEEQAKKLANIANQYKEMGLRGKKLRDATLQNMVDTGIAKDENEAKKMLKASAAENTKEQLANIGNNLKNALLDVIKQLNNTIDDIGLMKGAVDTRLQGSKRATGNGLFGIGSGSYWESISETITSIAAVSPFVKQSDINSKIKEMVSSGINYNVEQRAFLSVISEKIASTFDNNNSSLAKLIRIQQQDSTAARLGMESAMTAFLNNMYETTEYLSDVASEVRQNLYEAEALMSTEAAVSFDYQVQKWLGSLYSVGFSNTSSLSSALGKLASGDISGITDNGIGNLMVMAASNSGISIADALQNGLDESKTNQLMQAMVRYLGGIYTSTEGNLLLQQQYASVYGLTASDLKAAANLSNSISAISSNGLNYNGALAQLRNMAGSIYSRTSVGEMLSNVWDNIQYTMAASIANNPVTYAIYKAAGLLEGLGDMKVGGIFAMGTGGEGANLSTLMRVGALGAGVLSSIGSIVNGIGNSFSGTSMLDALKIGASTSVARGTGTGLLNTGVASVSSSGYVGNSSSSDIYNKSAADYNDDTSAQISAKEEETTSTKTIDEHIVNIYNILSDVVTGNSSFTVTVADYGLTGWNK